MIRVDVEEAQDRLEELVEAALRGEDAILEVGGIPQVTVVPIGSTVEDDLTDRPER